MKFAAIAMAASAASAVIQFAGARQAASASKAVGKANQQLAERDAQVAANNKIALQQKLQMDIEQADIEFEGLQADTAVGYRFRGVDVAEGTPMDMLLRNVSEFEYDKKVMEYNTTIAQQEQDEIATFARMKGQIASMQGRARSNLYMTQATTSLLGGAGKVAMIGAAYS